MSILYKCDLCRNTIEVDEEHPDGIVRHTIKVAVDNGVETFDACNSCAANMGMVEGKDKLDRDMLASSLKRVGRGY